MENEVKQRNQRNRRRERAQRMQAQRESKVKDGDSGEDESPAREKPPRPPARRKKSREPLGEEDIIDGFAIMAFRTYEDLEAAVKVAASPRTNALSTKPRLPLTTLTADSARIHPPNNVNSHGITLLHDAGTSDDSGRASERLTGSSVAPRDPDSSRDRLSDASSRCSSGKGYICDSEGDDDKASPENSRNASPRFHDASMDDGPDAGSLFRVTGAGGGGKNELVARGGSGGALALSRTPVGGSASPAPAPLPQPAPSPAPAALPPPALPPPPFRADPPHRPNGAHVPPEPHHPAAATQIPARAGPDTPERPASNTKPQTGARAAADSPTPAPPAPPAPSPLFPYQAHAAAALPDYRHTNHETRTEAAEPPPAPLDLHAQHLPRSLPPRAPPPAAPPPAAPPPAAPPPAAPPAAAPAAPRAAEPAVHHSRPFPLPSIGSSHVNSSVSSSIHGHVPPYQSQPGLPKHSVPPVYASRPSHHAPYGLPGLPPSSSNQPAPHLSHSMMNHAGHHPHAMMPSMPNHIGPMPPLGLGANAMPGYPPSMKHPGLPPSAPLMNHVDGLPVSSSAPTTATSVTSSHPMAPPTTDIRSQPAEPRPVPMDTRPQAVETRLAEPRPMDGRPPSRPHSRPSTIEARPGPLDARPGPLDARPSPMDTRPSPLDARPSSMDSRPSPLDSRPSPMDTRPSPMDTRPSPLDVRPGPLDARPGPLDARPNPLDTRPGPLESRQGPLEPRPNPLDARPNPLESRPSPLEPRPGSLDSRSGTLDPRPGPLEARPGPIEARPGPLDTRPSTLEPRPGPLDTRPMSSTAMDVVRSEHSIVSSTLSSNGYPPPAVYSSASYPPLYAPYASSLQHSPYLPPSAASPRNTADTRTSLSSPLVTPKTPKLVRPHTPASSSAGQLSFSPHARPPSRERESFSNISSLSRSTATSIPPVSSAPQLAPPLAAPLPAPLAHPMTAPLGPPLGPLGPPLGLTAPLATPTPTAAPTPQLPHSLAPVPTVPSISSGAKPAAHWGVTRGGAFAPAPPLFGAPMPPPNPNPFSAESLFQINPGADMLRRELDSRFLAAATRTEMHHHQHQHTHVHQHAPAHQLLVPHAPLLPPYKDVSKMPSLYRSGLGLGYPYSSSLLHPSAPYVPPAPLTSYAPKLPNAPEIAPKPPPKPPTSKTGKWNAMHVRIAWEIYNHQQKEKASSGAPAGEKEAPRSFPAPAPAAAPAPAPGAYRPYDAAAYAMHHAPLAARYEAERMRVAGGPFARYAPAGFPPPPAGFPMYARDMPLPPGLHGMGHAPLQLHDPWRSIPRAPPPAADQRREHEERERARRERDERERRDREERERRKARERELERTRTRSPLRNGSLEAGKEAVKEPARGPSLGGYGPPPHAWDPYRAFDPLQHMRFAPLVEAAIRAEEDRAKMFSAYAHHHQQMKAGALLHRGLGAPPPALPPSALPLPPLAPLAPLDLLKKEEPR